MSSSLLAGASDGVAELCAALVELNRHVASTDSVATPACRETFTTLLAALQGFASSRAASPNGKAMAPLRAVVPTLAEEVSYTRGDIVALLCVELATAIGRTCPDDAALVDVAVSNLRFFVELMCRDASLAPSLAATALAYISELPVCGTFVGGAILCEAAELAKAAGDAMDHDARPAAGHAPPTRGFALYRHACAILEDAGNDETGNSHYYMLGERCNARRPPTAFLVRRLEKDACAIIGWDEALYVSLFPHVLEHLPVPRGDLAELVHLYLLFAGDGEVEAQAAKLRDGASSALVLKGADDAELSDLTRLAKQSVGWGPRERGNLRSLVEAELAHRPAGARDAMLAHFVL